MDFIRKMASNVYIKAFWPMCEKTGESSQRRGSETGLPSANQDDSWRTKETRRGDGAPAQPQSGLQPELEAWVCLGKSPPPGATGRAGGPKPSPSLLHFAPEPEDRMGLCA